MLDDRKFILGVAVAGGVASASALGGVAACGCLGALAAAATASAGCIFSRISRAFEVILDVAGALQKRGDRDGRAKDDATENDGLAGLAAKKMTANCS